MKTTDECLSLLNDGLGSQIKSSSKYIQSIRLPLFKYFEPNTKIEFKSPITALVGRNGSGKSSLLQALFGCPKNFNTAEYWFSTPLDPIDDPDTKDSGQLRNSHVHTWIDDDGTEVECLQLRIFSEEKYGKEGWETSRHVKGYGPFNTRKRGSPVAKTVRYLDFRYMISSFDHYFYIGHKKSNVASKKQDYLRRRSIMLSKILSGEKAESEYEHLDCSVWEIETSSLEWTNYILGKQYQSGKLLEHNCYGRTQGFSVYFKTAKSGYSEAQAGSGETTIVKVVSEILSAPDESLILLDEPEFSLHPGSQRRMMQFLLNQAVEKHHQIVFGTHSPELIKNLPSDSIKLFRTDPSSENVGVVEDVHSDAAFLELEANPGNRTKILCEDKVSRVILMEVVNKLGSPYKEQIDIDLVPGGYPELVRMCVANSQINPLGRFFYFADGDKRSERIDIGQLTQDELKPENLLKKIKETLGQSPKLPMDSGTNDSLKTQKYCEFVGYLNSKFDWLPKTEPEEIIWDEAGAISVVSSINPTAETSKDLSNLNDKERIYKMSLLLDLSEESDHYLVMAKSLTKRWGQSEDSEFQQIVEKIKQWYSS